MSVKKTVFLAEEKKLIVKKYRHYRHTDKLAQTYATTGIEVSVFFTDIFTDIFFGGFGGSPPIFKVAKRSLLIFEGGKFMDVPEFTIKFDRTWIEELTTLEKALEVYQADKFLTVKKKLLGPEFDEETQTKIWQDYHDLFAKAVLGKFEKGDIELLEEYRRLEGHSETLYSLTGGEKFYFPTDLIRNNAGQIVRVTFDFFDREITKRWFNHIYDILVGREDVRVCTDEDCSNFFIRKRRQDKKFCSDTCRQRTWQRKYRKKK